MSADGVLRVRGVDKADGTSADVGIRRSQTVPTVRALPPLVWLNLICLDAPLVAVVWQELFARTFGIQLHWPVRAVLFLSAWLIYLADRWLDVLALTPVRPHAVRQEVWLTRPRSFAALTIIVGSADLLIGCFAMERSVFVSGMVVAVAAVVYLIMNHSCSGVWSIAPVKECWVGFVFAAGTVAALVPQIMRGSASLPPLMFALGLFALLCSLNCISIAVWETDIDLAQGKVSIATLRPAIGRWLNPFAAIIIGLTIVAAATNSNLTRLAVSVGVSAALLRLIPTMPVSRDQRTALADLVLLTPLLVMR
ncbi:MAG: hypothetical protein ACJ8M1_12990 [Chthoniobacterales bacterium]